MEHHTSSTITPERPLRIPRAIWVIGAGLVAALLAIFVFKVAVGTVFTFGLFGLMAFSHLFMHGGHGSHGSHGDSPPASGPDANVDQQDKPSGHSGGCH